MLNSLGLPALLTAASAVNAWWLVFGWGMDSASSPLAGKVLLAALVGGGAVAYSSGALLVLAPLGAVVAGSVGARRPTATRRRALAGVGFLAGFALAFVVAISGTPRAVASLVYKSDHVIELVGGAVLLVSGLVLVAQPLRDRRRPPGPLHWPRWVGPAGACLLGLVTGLVLAHELDPLYDSVFFLTGNPVAASHAPLTVVVFMVGLSLVVLSLGALTLMAAGHPVMGRWILASLRVAGGSVTVVIGAAFLSGQFSPIRTWLLP